VTRRHAASARNLVTKRKTAGTGKGKGRGNEKEKRTSGKIIWPVVVRLYM
jgi:hypothetical protein